MASNRKRTATRLPISVECAWPPSGRGNGLRVPIRDKRWCPRRGASDGTLRFNWRAMMLEPAIVQYIVVHELANPWIKNHGPDFRGPVAVRSVREVQERDLRINGEMPDSPATSR